MKIAIAYSPGSYGSYLHWALDTLVNQTSVCSPLTELGNSHNAKKPAANMFEDLPRMLETANDHISFFRIHPKNHKSHSLSRNLETLAANVDRTIHLYPAAEDALLVANNYYQKVYPSEATWWESHITGDDLDRLRNNWPVTNGASILEIPIWVRREFLSLYLWPSWFDQVEWYHPDRWQDPRCHVVLVRDLLDNFEVTIDHILDLCGIVPVQKTQDLRWVHDEMLQMQRNLSQDRICSSIVDSVQTGSEFDWSSDPVSLISSSWVQWKLRQLGWELMCDGLDVFPTNSVELQKLIYPANV